MAINVIIIHNFPYPVKKLPPANLEAKQVIINKGVSMAIGPRLDLRQSQSLTMTPQLQQAIKLLAMSNQELAAFVESELEKNPLLEREEGSPEPSADTPSAESSSSEDSGDAQTSSEPGSYDATANDSFANVGKGGSSNFETSDFGLENTMADEKSLRAHLTEQIHIEFRDARTLGIALLLIDFLDESGYCRGDLDKLAERLGCARELIEIVILRLQHLDPPGIFARSLAECLAIQLREKNRLDPAMKALLDNLDLLAKHDLKALKSACGVDEADLKDMIAEIKSLDPKPALAFDHFVSQTVVPDVYMRTLPKSKGGGWTVELNNDTLPRVLVNQVYCTEVSKSARSKEDKEYINTQLATANWLVKAMDQRAQTILKTAAEIITQQEAFFTYGVEFLKPLVLKDVADVIGMHESTVSRVTTNKYIGTPRGAFELKYFFSSGVGSTDGGGAEFASGAVQARIKSLIDAEKPSSILSDDDIAAALKADGIDVARRTVAKYREAMKIASSVQRRRQKK